MNKRKLGVMYIQESLFLSDGFAEALAKIEFVPAKVEMLYCSNLFEYIGYSPMFRELDEDERAPEYELLIKNHNSCMMDVNVSEVDKNDEKCPF